MKYQTISLKQFFPAKGAIYYVAIATVIFSHVKIAFVKISCLRAKAHLVFLWCLYNKIKNYMLTGAGQQRQDGILSPLKRSFSYRGAMAWNQLSNQTRGMDVTSVKLAIS